MTFGPRLCCVMADGVSGFAFLFPLLWFGEGSLNCARPFVVVERSYGNVDK